MKIEGRTFDDDDVLKKPESDKKLFFLIIPVAIASFILILFIVWCCYQRKKRKEFEQMHMSLNADITKLIPKTVYCSVPNTTRVKGTTLNDTSDRFHTEESSMNLDSFASKDNELKITIPGIQPNMSLGRESHSIMGY